MVKYTKIVDKLSAEVPFVGPETQERKSGKNFQVRIGANESVFGPSSKAIDAMRKSVANETWKYGDPENYALKAEIASFLNVSTDNIIVGEGIDGLLGYLVRLCVSKETKVVTSAGAYPTFNYHVRGFGGNLKMVPYVDNYEDIESLLLEAKRQEASLIYLANPDNPMGTFHDSQSIEDMVESLPKNCLLCLDEAYIDFVPKDLFPNISVDHPQVIRFRTFSKAFGMAGARIGYGIGEATLIKSFDKIRNHFGVSRVAQVGAITSLRDKSIYRIKLDGIFLTSTPPPTFLSFMNKLDALSLFNFLTSILLAVCGLMCT